MAIEIDMSDAVAEQQLLELIRGLDAENFSLTIVCADGRWMVTTEDLDAAGGKTIGEGNSYAEAWLRRGQQLCRSMASPRPSVG